MEKIDDVATALDPGEKFDSEEQHDLISFFSFELPEQKALYVEIIAESTVFGYLSKDRVPKESEGANFIRAIHHYHMVLDT
jgi:hypothetical protein